MTLTAPHNTPAHVLAQTWADGQHEWADATTARDRIGVIARLGVALLRVCVWVTAAESRKAIHTPLMRRWLVVSVSLAFLLWMDVVFRPGHHPAYLVDLGERHLLVMLPVLAILAFARRRDADTALIGSVAVVEIVVLTWLFLLLPFGMAARYTSFYAGRVYVSPPMAVLTKWVLSMAVASTAILVVSGRVIRHQRRPFLTCLAFLLPILTSFGLMELYDRWRPALIRLFIVIGSSEVVIAATAIGLLVLYVGLVWEERASSVTEDPGQGRVQP